jgi:hypothetical protein
MVLNGTGQRLGMEILLYFFMAFLKVGNAGNTKFQN